MYCGYCKKELKGNEKFCPKCGKEVNVGNVAEPKPNKRKNIKRICIIAGLLVVLLASCIAGVFVLNKNGRLGLKMIGDTYIALVKDENGKYGYIDQKGNEIIACQYDFASPFMSNGLATFGVENGGDEDGDTIYKYGFINTEGEEIVPAIYDKVDWDFCGSSNEQQYIAVAKQVGEDSFGFEKYAWGWMDKSGKLVVECKYGSLYAPYWKNGMCIVSTLDNDYGVIDAYGKEVIPIGKYDSISSMSNDGLFAVAVKENDEYKWGVVDSKGDQVIPFIYKYVTMSSDSDLISVVIDEWMNENLERISKRKFINKKGQDVFSGEYMETSNFKNGYAFVNELKNFRNNTGGYINEYGKKITDGKYCYGFGMDKEGRAIAEMYDNINDSYNYGIVDSTGKEIVPCRNWWLTNKEARRFGSSSLGAYYQDNILDYCIVGSEGQYGLLNIEGEITIPVQYDLMWYGDNGWFAVGNLRETIDENDSEDKEYIMAYVDEKGSIKLQLPEKYIFASEFTKIEDNNK